ncbi:MAG: histone deacetylase [Chitinivibrionales bacterium]|nr:histone deacetylase [Chitinivibrionales bacterium]
MENTGVSSHSTAKKGTGFVYHDKYARHQLTQGHPECPQRLEAIREMMASEGFDKRVCSLSPVDDMAKVLSFVRKIHSEEHCESLKENPETWEVAMLAAGGAMAGVDAVFSGQCKNVFCALRPPGHHANNNGLHYDGLNQGEGFCFINNIAVAARYAQAAWGCKDILIIDWDIHHGNGTEWAFYEDPTVFYFSTHVFWTFPGTGHPGKKGRGAGEGYTLNCPLEPYSGDDEILQVWDDTFIPALKKVDFKADCMMISAGFDCKENDLLGNLGITDGGIEELTRRSMVLADEHCDGRLVSVLEGGYTLDSLADAVNTHITTLLTK